MTALPRGIEAAEHPIQWWLEAVATGMTRPPKNELLGFPRIPASTLLPNLAANYRARRGDGAGSSSQAPGSSSQAPGSNVLYPIFFIVVRTIMEDASTNPAAYHTPLTDEQANDLASAAL